MRRVFVHVGSPKTGTTFLQGVLWSQRRLAAEQGLLLPLDSFFDHYLATLDVRGLAGREDHPERAVGAWERLATAALEGEGTSLVSHELFAAATDEQAAAALAVFGEAEVHVVLTARDLVRQVPAEWQEHVKHRLTKALPEFVDDLRKDTARRRWFWQVQDFADVLGRWGRTLPPGRVHVVTVPPSGSPPEVLWGRFASLLGLEPGAFDLHVPRTNTSLGFEQAELLRRLNVELGSRLPLPGPYTGVVKNVLAQQVLAGRSGTPLALDREDTEFALERSRDIARRLSEAAVQVVGELDELVPDAAGLPFEPWSAYPETGDAVLAQEGLAALASVLPVLAEQRAENRRLRERIREIREAPYRFAMIRSSERRPLVGRARKVYQRRPHLRSLVQRSSRGRAAEE
ncbi:MAG TPA: hypothetical protein VFG72_04490 [Marmoricola sp.]|nr:hypothetical protein [Marmoricola sp.]